MDPMVDARGPKSVLSKLAPNTIRVFELFPASDGAPIAGSLREIHLESEHEPYEALSYAWGNTELRKPINCNGFTICITENLHRILSLLRRSNVSLILWVDALCINQGTDNAALEEKAQQIKFMNVIFATASRVIIDLGPTMEDLGYLLAGLEQYIIAEKNAKADITLPDSERPDISDVRLWQQLLSLIQLPWFQRLWCFQEFILAREIVTIVGSRLVAHFDLHLAITKALYSLEQAAADGDLSELATELHTNFEIISRFNSLLHRKQTMREYRQTGEMLLLDAVFTGSRFLDVSDPRDRIYAIHALLPSDIRRNFRVDYSETVQALQERISIHLIQEYYGVWVLMYAIGPSQQQPSWTMTISTDEKLYWRQEWFALCSGSLNDFANSADGLTFCAGGSLPRELKVDIYSKQITTKGCVFGNVVSLSDQFPPIQNDDYLRSLSNHLDSMVSVMHWAQLNEVSDEILWRLLSFDGYGHMRADKRYLESDYRDTVVRESYQSWKNYIYCLQTEPVDLDSAVAYANAGKLFYQVCASAMPNMRLAMTGRGHPAVVPYTAHVDDQVTILCGVPAAFVFRPMDTQHQIVGPCYLYGFMEGQALRHKDWKPETLTIV